MGDIMYSNWFGNIYDPSRPGELDPNCDIDSMKRKHQYSETMLTTKRQKTSNNNGASEEDESWIDDLFVLEDEAIDVPPVDLGDQSTFVSSDPAPQASQQEFLSNVVGKVLSRLNGDEEDPLLGEFSRSFLENTGSSTTDDGAGNANMPPRAVSVEALVGVPAATNACQVSSFLTAQPPALEPTPFAENISPATVGGTIDDIASPPSHMSDLEATKFTIDYVKNCSKPMLLTLTSFPFRVLYANSAYQQMAGTDSNIIGKTFYDIFVNEGKEVPSFGTCSNLLGKFQGDIVRVKSSAKEDGEYSSIQVRPIFKNGKSAESGLRYYAVTLEQLQVSNGSSIVYLPMPSGSMVKF